MRRLSLKVCACVYLCVTVRIAAQEECMYMHYTGTSHKLEEKDCAEINEVCRKRFNIYFVDNIRPYSDREILEEILKRCCGICLRPPMVMHLPNLTMVSPRVVNSSNFVYPFLASSTAAKLFGHYFIPVVRAPSLFYITPKDEPVLVQLIMSCLRLYPLIIICFLMALISGFCAWILETWKNKDEFPRDFLGGWFEGFWWSFISMTTVGYGDKTPKSIPARLFSVLWIFIGIAIFGIVTALITNELMNANAPPPPRVDGSTVGVLKFREYDASFVARNGGVIVRSGPHGDDFKTDIFALIRKLRMKEINGILMDKHTLSFTIDYCKEIRHLMKNDYLADIVFFLDNSIRTEHFYKGDGMSYGILVKHLDDYKYFHAAIVDNRLSLDTELAVKWNKRDATVGKPSLFDPTGEYFLSSVKGMACILGLICVFGMLYEFKRKKYPQTNKFITAIRSPSKGEINSYSFSRDVYSISQG